MTTVVVQSGACGYTVTVTAERSGRGAIAVTLGTDCEMVKKMQEDVATLDRMATLADILNNPVYRSAGKHLKHAACPVPAGILKAVEVEAGLNVSKDARITFVVPS